MTYGRIPLRLLLALPLAICIGSLSPASAQFPNFESLSRWQLAAQLSASTYNGDFEARQLDGMPVGWAAGGEMAFQFTQAVGIAIGGRTTRHPRLYEPEAFRYTVQGLLRFTQPAGQRVAPYLHVGYHYTSGAGREGSGPVAGVGLNWRLSDRLALYQEATINVVRPGNVLDPDATRSGFDALGSFGIGFRITSLRRFFGRTPRPTRPVGYVSQASITSASQPTVVAPATTAEVTVVPDTLQVQEESEATPPETAQAPASHPQEPVSHQATPEPSTGPFSWVIASFSAREQAAQMVHAYREAGYAPIVFADASESPLRYQLTLGYYSSRRWAEHNRSDLPEGVHIQPWLLNLDQDNLEKIRIPFKSDSP